MDVRAEAFDYGLVLQNSTFSSCSYFNESGSIDISIARDKFLTLRLYDSEEIPEWSIFEVQESIEYYLLMHQCIPRQIYALLSWNDTMHINASTEFELDFSVIQPNQTQGFCVIDKD